MKNISMKRIYCILSLLTFINSQANAASLDEIVHQGVIDNAVYPETVRLTLARVISESVSNTGAVDKKTSLPLLKGSIRFKDNAGVESYFSMIETATEIPALLKVLLKLESGGKYNLRLNCKRKSAFYETKLQVFYIQKEAAPHINGVNDCILSGASKIL